MREPEDIIVTFPLHIPKETVKNYIEETLVEAADLFCLVSFLKEEDDENNYLISSDGGPEAFYIIGMTATILIQKYEQ